MTIRSSGILLYRFGGAFAQGLEVLLAHPGGPFYARKDDGSWGIPKGEFDPAEEDACTAARREFAEETGTRLGDGETLDLGWIEQRKGKQVHAYAIEGDFDPRTLVSNEFEMEWPPRSGTRQSFPEVDRAEWFTPDAARLKILPSQAVFLDRLLEALATSSA
jgi:predicted NUDIX family NTP pyrophosphohydrolase